MKSLYITQRVTGFIAETCNAAACITANVMSLPLMCTAFANVPTIPGPRIANALHRDTAVMPR